MNYYFFLFNFNFNLLFAKYFLMISIFENKMKLLISYFPKFNKILIPIPLISPIVIAMILFINYS